MKDLIDRQAAIDALAKELKGLFVEYRDVAEKLIGKLPSAQPDNRLSKIADLVEGTIDHFDLDDAMDLLYQIKDVLEDELPSAQPEPHYDEWCDDCKEYDKERHCCPRWNRVIRQTLKDAQPEQRWIPVAERLPAYGEDVLISIGGYCNVGHIVPVNEEEQYHWYFSGWYHFPNDVDAWMPLPEPWKEGEADG